MTLTEKELDEFVALFKEEGWQVTREEVREGVFRVLSLYEFLMRPTAAEIEALRLDAANTPAKVKGESLPQSDT
jgi:hypothetical protein